MTTSHAERAVQAIEQARALPTESSRRRELFLEAQVEAMLSIGEHLASVTRAITRAGLALTALRAARRPVPRTVPSRSGGPRAAQPRRGWTS